MAKEILEDPLLYEKPLGMDKTSFRPASSSRSYFSRHALSRSQSVEPRPTPDLTLLQKKLLEIDLLPIKADAQLDVNMRKKLGNDAVPMDKPEKSLLVPDIESKLAAEFTRRSLEEKVRLVFSEVFRCYHLASLSTATRSSKWEWRVYPSEIFSASSCVDLVAVILSVLSSGFEDVVPFANVCHSVLHLPHGLWMLDQMLQQNSKRLLSVCDFLMAQCSGDDIDDQCSIFYGKILLHLSRTFPRNAQQLHHMAMGRQNFFVLVLSLTLEKYRTGIGLSAECADEKVPLDAAVVDLFHQLLVAPKGESREWGVKCVRLAGQVHNAQFLECRLQILVNAHRVLPAGTLYLTEDQLPAASRLVEIYVHFKESCLLSLTVEEYHVLAKLLTCRTPLSATGNDYVVLGLCCFTAFPELIVEKTVEIGSRATEFDRAHREAKTNPPRNCIIDHIRLPWDGWCIYVGSLSPVLAMRLREFQKQSSGQFSVLVTGFCIIILLRDGLVYRLAWMAAALFWKDLEFIEWIKWQLEVDVTALDEKMPMGGTSLEVLLLLASHLRAGQYKEISDMLSEYLHCHVNVKPQMVVRLKFVINSEIFKEDGLLRHSLRVPPTLNLNSSFESALPVHCIYNILQNKTYISYNVSVKEWILNQMRKCSLPLHPMMIQVLILYVQTTLPILRKTSDGPEDYTSLQMPFTPVEICSIMFDVPEGELTNKMVKKLRSVDLFQREDSMDPYRNVAKVLMAFYVLAYNDFYMNNLKTFLMAKFVNAQPYGTDLLEKIPFKHYLVLATKHQDLFDPLGDVLGRLMLQLLPHMRTVFDEIHTARATDKLDGGRSPRQTARIFQHFLVKDVPSAGSLTRYLDLLTRYPADKIGGCMDEFLTIIPRILNEDLSPVSQDAFEKVWTQLADVDPNTLLLATTEAFLQQKDPLVSTLTFQDLCFEPLHVLRCDDIVFRKPFLTRILLRVFSSYMTASKVYLTQQLEIIDQQQLLQANSETVDSVREERKHAMFMLQESVAAQILIEKLKVDQSLDFALPGKLTESQDAICTFIHQMIIANSKLAKLIVFQGFPPSRIPVIVRGVESLHICFEYLHEAMALPSMEKKLFVLELTSCLCVKFRIARTLVVAKLAVDVSNTLLLAYPCSVRREVIRVGARCLARLGNVFPPLREECLAILNQMADLEKSAGKASRAWRNVARDVLVGSAGEKGLNGVLTAAIECAKGTVLLKS